jgi:hypothetical protein
MIDTLLHEMIHAYLFVTASNKYITPHHRLPDLSLSADVGL